MGAKRKRVTDDVGKGKKVKSDKPVPNKEPRFAKDCDGIRYWLIKSEPLSRIDPKTGSDAAFPLSSLKAVDSEPWDGVRNHEAKNNMLHMSVGDVCLFYHSNCPNPGIVGLATVSSEAHPDESQFDPSHKYYAPKSTRGKPLWWCCDVRYKNKFRRKVSLAEIRENPKLQEMMLVKRGRLSVTPVAPEEYREILRMEKEGKASNDLDCSV